MSALHKCTQKKPNRLHWKQLFAAGYKRICQHFEQHNQRFPAGKDQPYSYAYPHRIKDSEIKTAVNAFRDWCKQTAAQLESGERYLTNSVRTNNRKLRETAGGDGSKSVTPNHLAKLAYCGFLCGEEETDIQPHEQQVYRHRDRGGKGFGWRPHKRFRGRKNDYELLLNPALLPTDLLTPQALFVAKTESFAARVRALTSDTPSPPLLNQKLLPSQASHTAERNKEMSQKVSAQEADVCQEERKLEEGSPPKAGNISSENQAFSLPAAFQLTQSNQKTTYYAQLLVSLYQNKLATAMGRDYKSQYLRAFHSALKLLKSVPDDQLEAFNDRLVQVIDHQEKRLLLYPEAFVVGPVRFFEPKEKYGILHYEKNWLQVYERRSVEFEEMAQARGRKSQEQLDGEAEIAQQDKKWYFLGWRFKNALMRMHPKDMRLRKANLANWERDIRLLVRKDGIPAKELIAVMDWLLKSALPNAQWWRSQYNLDGIKSTSSLRKHYAKLRIAYDQDQAAAPVANPIPENPKAPAQIPQDKSAARQIPSKHRGPKQIPKAGIFKKDRR